MTAWKRLARILKSNLRWGAWGPEPELADETAGPSRGPASAAPERQDPKLAKYYANLEISYGTDLETARRAWKTLLKKYHPDLHSASEEKRQIANTVTRDLNTAFREIEKVLTTTKEA